MAGTMSFTMLDHSNEQSTVRIYTPTIDGANIADYTDDTLGGALGDGRLALAALSEMNHLRRQVVATKIADVAALPANPSAQRERKAVVTYLDTVTGKYYSISIPGFNMVGAEAGTDVLDLDVAQWVAFRAWFEAKATSELENPVTIITAKHAGRAS